jgi:hypothetical protein
LLKSAFPHIVICLVQRHLSLSVSFFKPACFPLKFWFIV